MQQNKFSEYNEIFRKTTVLSSFLFSCLQMSFSHLGKTCSKITIKPPVMESLFSSVITLTIILSRYIKTQQHSK